MDNIESKTNFKEETIKSFLEKYQKSLHEGFNKTEKIKLCSNEDFTMVAEQLEKEYPDKKNQNIISQVGGFYVIASLIGIANNKGISPNVLFFDRKNDNLQNAIYNTLLIKCCDTKEEYLTKLFGLGEAEIIKILNPQTYITFIEEILSKDHNFQDLTKKEKNELIKKLYHDNQEEIDKIIKKEYIKEDTTRHLLKEEFNLKKIINYLNKRKYNQEEHYNLLISKASKKLDKETLELFKLVAKNITIYLSKKDNYQDLIKYLPEDIKINEEYHLLSNDKIYNSYRKLINQKSSGSIKFLPDIDISIEKGINELKKILNDIGFTNEDNHEEFPIYMAFLPHIDLLKNSYSFIKNTTANYIKLNRLTGKKKSFFSINSTATLEQRTYKNIGAEFIEEERNNRIPLKKIHQLEKEKGFPILSFMAGANFGNIYHSETDTQNMIDIAIANKVDTMYIQGLIYSTYFHKQTSRRQLIDPLYENLDSRLKAARNIIKRLNDAGIKVVYQMGDEEFNLYEDMFKSYTKEQGVTGNNFLEREDLRSKYDWVRPIIIEQLIPYLIRSGEDLTNYHTDEAKETRISNLCHALKLHNEGLPLGNLSKYIKPEFLKDTDMFKVVFSTIDNYNDKDEALSVNLEPNPNFSSGAQYGVPYSGIVKKLKLYQTGATNKYKLEKIPQLFVDSRQGYMSIATYGDQVVLNVPQMIDDKRYIEHPEMLPGIKEHILSDPTHKRVTQSSAKINVPGGWIITGDAREILEIKPYTQRVKEVMNYVQATGEGLKEINLLNYNDLQTGSPTERLSYIVKALDYARYQRKCQIVIANGDLQQGWNYPGFAIESRYGSGISVTDQQITNLKLIRPIIRDSLGIIKSTEFITANNDYEITENISKKIINHLIKRNLIIPNCGEYQNFTLINKEIDYKTVDLKLPKDLRPYENHIRKTLDRLLIFDSFHINDGNHELNTDWSDKGYRLIELLRQEILNNNKLVGCDIEIPKSEFFINQKGDIVQGAYTSKTINGYNMIFGHNFKASSSTPTIAMRNYFNALGPLANNIHMANGAHLHIFEMSVNNNRIDTITGGLAGQSGYEQKLGYSSEPRVVINRFFPDGSIGVEVLGQKFLDEYEIQNPEIKEIGLDNHIANCLTEEVPYFGPTIPDKVQEIKQRKLTPAKPNRIIGPKID